MHRRTVRRYLATPAPRHNRPSERPKPSGLSSPTLQPFVEYLPSSVALEEILLDGERLKAGYTLLQQFRRLIARRGVRDLDHWLKQAASSGLRPFVSLAHGIQSDSAAVVNGLKLP